MAQAQSPYGLTSGLNPGKQYPVTSRLNQTAVNLAVADGLANYRFQLDAKYIWRNQSDDWTLWDWAPLDDAVSKLTQAGMNISYPLRGWPDWGLQNPLFQATTEPHFMPDPAVVLVFALGVAQRYNGVYAIPGYGPMLIHNIEIGNEEYNLYFTPVDKGFYGLRNSPYAIYNGVKGITTANGKPQPARDPYWMQQVLLGVVPTLRQTVAPGVKIGMGAVWWMNDANFYDFIFGLSTALGLVDYLNFHYYTNKSDPINPAVAHLPSITTAIQNMANAANDLGYSGLNIWCTEFGWQVTEDCNEPTQAVRYQAVLDACRTSGRVERVYLFTYDASTHPVHSSLYTWNGTGYTPRQAVSTLKTFIQQYPFWTAAAPPPVGLALPEVEQAVIQLLTNDGAGTTQDFMGGAAGDTVNPSPAPALTDPPATGTMAALCRGVFEAVDTGQLFPYVTVGDSSELMADTFDRRLREVTLTLHIWSQYKGFAEAIAIQDRIDALLNRQRLSGMHTFHHVSTLYDSGQLLRDPDGITRHGISRYKILVEQN